LREFFGGALGTRLANEGKQADLILGNNVYAHVSRYQRFHARPEGGVKPGGVVTLEFPHLLRLMEETQFDTVYHEHFSYLSLHTVARIFASAGLRVWDVQQLPTHGGACVYSGAMPRTPGRPVLPYRRCSPQRSDSVCGSSRATARSSRRADRVKNDLLHYLIEQKRAGVSVAAYGAAAKGNTLLNYAGVRPDLLDYVCDAAPSKQGKYMPGSHIPIFPPAQLRARKPQVVLILPWNIATEVTAQHALRLRLGREVS